MKTYKLPDALGGGDLELLTDQTPTRLECEFVWVRHEALGLIQVDRRRLAIALPPEPADGTVVTTGKKVFLRQVTATHGGEQSWWRTGDNEPWDWAMVCSTGSPIRLVLEPPNAGAGAR